MTLFKFSDYFRPDEVEAPKQFTWWKYHANNDWTALESFDLDSVVAGATNETRVRVTEAGHDFYTTGAEVTRNANEVGEVEGEDITDRMVRVAEYRRTTGLSDGYAFRHHIGAYLAVGTVAELKSAVALFGPVGVGLNFTDKALEAFLKRNPWDVEKGAKKIGQQYVSVTGFDGEWLEAVIYGRQVSMSEKFYKKYAALSLAYIPEEFLAKGRTMRGMDLDSLQVQLREDADL